VFAAFKPPDCHGVSISSPRSSAGPQDWLSQALLIHALHTHISNKIVEQPKYKRR
jgi:hypothetical protein